MPPAARDLLGLTYFGNAVAAWLVALGVLAGGWGALVLLRRLLLRRVEGFAARTTTAADDLAADALRRTRGAFLFALALVAAAKVAVVLPRNLETAVELIAKIAFLLQAASWGSGAITFWVEHATRRRAASDRASVGTLNVLGIIARFVLWALILLLALAAFGINITALVTGLGIAGVAVALAVQNVLGDLLASLSIALDKPFVVGDTIAFDAFTGTVEDIGLKTTRLRSVSGEQIVVSNAELLKARIRNYQRQTERRVAFTVGVAYDTPHERVARAPQVMREAIERNAPVRFDRAHFLAFQESALTLEAVYFVESADYNLYMDIQQRINLEILERFRAEGIEFAAPARAVLLREGPPGSADNTPGIAAVTPTIPGR